MKTLGQIGFEAAFPLGDWNSVGEIIQETWERGGVAIAEALVRASTNDELDILEVTGLHKEPEFSKEDLKGIQGLELAVRNVVAYAKQPQMQQGGTEFDKLTMGD